MRAIDLAPGPVDEPGAPWERSLTERISAQARATPHAIALQQGERTMSYARLEQLSERWAALLLDAGVGPESLVAVCMHRGLVLVVAILAIAKAGGAFVLLDPEQPQARLRELIEDARPVALMTDEALLESLPALRDATRIWTVPESGEAPQGQGVSRPAGPSEASHLAYVVYTSGSTGRPKGALIEQRGLRNLVHCLVEFLAVTPQDVILLQGSVAFDGSLWSFFVPLVAGARLVLAEPGLQADMSRLLRTISRQRVTVAGFVPSVLRAWLDQIALDTPAEPMHLRHVICGGEVLDISLARRFHERFPGVVLSNSYGPSEACIACSWQVVEAAQLPAGAGTIPIGRPIPNASIHVLDEQLRPQPIGAPGQIHIGGVGVGRGYLRRDELSARRFIPDPFLGQGRLYATGDIARWNADGSLDFVGRMDQQVKLRGLRIELGEVEAALQRIAGVREAVVLLLGQQPDSVQLAACVVAHGLDSTRLRHELRAQLPDAMVPGRFVFFDALPRLPSGKIDRHALTAAAAEAGPAEAPVAPRYPLESVVLDVFRRVLQQPAAGIHDDFFALGGHSLVIARLGVELHRALGVELPVQALFEHSSAAQLAAAIGARAAPEQPVPGVRANPASAPGIPRIDRHGPLPVSLAQRRMWLLHQVDPAGSAYNVRMALRMHGRLDVAALQRALEDLVGRHEAFRTRFRFAADEPAALIDAQAPAVLEWIAPAQDRPGSGVPESWWLDAAAERAAASFDLERGPLHRFVLARIGDDDHLLVIAMHHIVADDASFGVLARELNHLYEAHAAGAPADLSERLIDHVDHAAWQRRNVDPRALAGHMDYWTARLAGLQALNLPSDKGQGRRTGSQGARVRVPLAPAWLQAVRGFSAQAAVTPFMTLLAAWVSLLGRWCAQEDVCIASVMSARTMPHARTLVGPLLHTLLLRARVDAGHSFRSFLQQEIRETALGAMAHQEISLDDLVARLRAQGVVAAAAEPRALFNLINNPRATWDFSELRIEDQALPWHATQFDLSLTISTETLPALVIDYSTELFEPASIEALAQLYLLGVERALADPGQPLAALWVAPESQLLRIAAWNDTFVRAPGHATIIELLGLQRDNPCIALSDACGLALSHAQLWGAVDRLSELLRVHGVRRGNIVGLGMRRGAGMVVALLAVLQAGAAYLPLDPEFPEARLRAMIDDAQPVLLLSSEDLLDTWGGMGVALLTPPDPASPAAQALDPALPADAPCGASPEDPAYLIYTSGSTGKPKGVLVPHRAVVNLLATMARQPGMGADDVLVAVTTLGFDIAVLELLLGLYVGARICVASRDEALDPTALQARLRASAATMMQATPATWRMLLDTDWAPPRGFKALVGGETLRPELARALQARCAEVWNLYGPTETTVWSTCWRVDARAERISIGSPIANTQVHVLDEQGHPCPIGFSGEIHIAGEGVALGYHRRPDLDRERFIPGPRHDDQASRMYRTGDRGRWRHDGLLEHLGRVDFQVKLRGYRIETGEIESCLAEQAEVTEAVVALRDDRPEDPRLVAYVALRQGADREHAADALRQALRGRLPGYMIPQHIEVLASLPRLPNGKIDRQALPRPHETRPARGDEPRGAAERLLAGIWCEQLGLRQVRRDDNFFDLGGHSLIAHRVTVLFEAATGQRIALPRLIHETLAQLAMGVELDAAVAIPSSTRQRPAHARGPWWRRLRARLGRRG